MRIFIQENKGKKLLLWFPTGLALNRLTAFFAARQLREQGMHISARQLYALFREIKAFKARHSKWTLVEVYDHEGEAVRIIL